MLLILSIIFKFLYAECRYAECRYSQSRKKDIKLSAVMLNAVMLSCEHFKTNLLVGAPKLPKYYFKRSYCGFDKDPRPKHICKKVVNYVYNIIEVKANNSTIEKSFLGTREAPMVCKKCYLVPTGLVTTLSTSLNTFVQP